MNEVKQNTGKLASAIESEIENINSQLNRIEKTISVCLENFRRLDVPANKVNPDDFFRNIPHNDTPEISGSMNKEDVLVEPYVKSGIILKLNELSLYAKQIERQLSDFNEYNIVPVGIFFERNI